MPTVKEEAAARISRLQNAIGDGPHSVEIDPAEHLRGILITLRDTTAIALLKVPAKAA